MSSRVLAAGFLGVVLGACASSGGAMPSDTGASSAEPSGPGASVAAPASSGGATPASASPSPSYVTRAGLATDEPCTRAIAPDAEPDASIFRLEDLQRMVLTPEDLGGLPGYEIDPFGHGYQGNGELGMLEVHPESLCDDLRAFGRITGFSESSIAMSDTSSPKVASTAHLFWDQQEARAWLAAFVAAMEAAAGASDGSFRFDVEPLAGLNEGDVLATHVGADGTRTWAMFVRGPVLGWLVDLHPGTKPTIDVPAAAIQMAARIDAVAVEAASREPSGPDVTHLMSMPLPLAAYGDRYRELAWDEGFGGCTDTIERGFIAGEEAAADARRFGRIAGCTAMYSPADMASSRIVRVFSGAQTYGDVAGASGALDKALADMVAQGGRSIDVATLLDRPLGDEIGIVVTPPGGDRDFTDTRAVMRFGTLLGSVVIQDRDARDVSAEIAGLATQLADRVDRLTATDP